MTETVLKLKITDLLKKYNTYNEFIKNLKIEIPDLIVKENEELALIANKFKTNNLDISELESECKNIILDKKNLNLLVYSYNSIYYNDDANFFMLKEDIINNYEQEIYESYEGTTLTVFNFNNKWYLSTRKELDAKKSIWKGNKSYYNLFCETVNCKFDEFTKNLKKEYYYFFVLIHNENKNIVDYTEKFGINYKEVIHIMTRKSNNHEEIKLDDKNQFKNNMNLKISKKLKSLDTINELNNKTKLSLPIKNEGVIIKLTNKLTKKLMF